jgi:4-amino-4-deoxy-L-arabinose transferase-like glycosyltransferase
MKDRKFWIIVILAALVYGANFWGTSIYILDEAKNASCAMEMLQRKNFIVPTFNNELRTDKPPLHYYAMMVAYTLWDVNPFSARLFSVIAGVLTVVLVFRFVRKIMDENTAWFTAIVMISSLQLSIQFHLAVPDPYLILFMTGSFLFFYDGYVLNNKKNLYWFYVFAALGFLSKGLIAVVLPGIVILLFMAWRKQLNLDGIRRLALWPGAVLFLIIAAPWYIWVGYETHGAWLEGFFLKHNLERYTSTMEGHRGFFGVPVIIVIGALMPFSIFIVHAVRKVWTDRNENAFLLFSLLIALVIPGFFCFSKTILPSYPGPSLPFIAIVLGYYLAHGFSKSSFRRSKMYIPFALYMLIAIAVPVAIYIALTQESGLKHIGYVSLFFCVLPILAAAGIYLYARKEYAKSIYAWAASWMLVSLIFFYLAYPKLDAEGPVQRSLEMFDGGKQVAYYGNFNPAYVFAFKHPVPQLHEAGDVKAFFEKNPNGLLITYNKFLPALDTIQEAQVSFRCRDLFENRETIVMERK